MLRSRLFALPLAFFVTLLTSCASTEKPPAMSNAATLLVDTKIQSVSDIKEIIEQANKAKASQDIANKVRVDTDGLTDVVFGSGLVSSAAVLSSTGQWVSMGNFTNWTDIGMGVLTFLASSDMTRHPLTYTYIFNQDPTCNELTCAEEAIADYFKDMSKTYLASQYSAPLSVDEVEIARSNWVLDRVTLFHNYSVEPGESDADWRIMSVVNLAEINDEKGIWGNEDPYEMQDHVGFRNMDYIAASNMLIEVSKRHPNILIYRGIDASAMDDEKPCYGGYFIRNGEPLVIDELNCVKRIDEAN